MPNDDHDGITQADLAELDDLIWTTTSGLESLQIDTYEKVATLADEITKIQEMVKGLGRMIRQEIVPLLPRLTSPYGDE
jgi:hypothetical protein